MQPVDFAVIAAAGLGSRLGYGIPKCMLEIGGSTLLSKLIDTLTPLVRRIHVVVGYREEMIVDLVARRHRDVVLVRNPQFRTTNTAQSMALGARGCHGKVLFLDGDLLIEPESLQAFVTEAACHPLLIGVTPSSSENAVYVTTRTQARGETLVTGFTRTQATPLEWANVFAGPADALDGEVRYVFNRLEQQLPIPCSELNLREVDTVADLSEARRFDLHLRKQ
ncbi:NTP transferase domain-containing protein [Hydrogenophaga luteola]|uniref:NTP transferase domain-containing protein n=1 Tax=Hydrogenophaga luteola TaxID=1591122 RepID=A0ABV7VWY0_9BURK